jgi:ABC-type lipoprotein release transport system permease subunit
MTGTGRFGRSRHARLQRLLAVAAIGAAVALPVVLVSVGGGVASHELAQLTGAGYQIVVSAAGAHGISGAHNLTQRLLGIAGVAAVSPTLSIPLDAFDGAGGPFPVLAEGVIPGQFGPTLGAADAALFPSPLGIGDPTDRLHFDNGTYGGPATWEVLVSTPYASATGVVPGDSILLSPSSNTSQGIRFNVTGTFGIPVSLFAPTGAFAVVVPLSDLQVLTEYANGSGTIVPDAADSIEIGAVPSIADQPSAISALAQAIQRVVPFFTVSTLQQQASEAASANAILTGFYLALSSVGIVVGVLFLTLVLVRRVETNRRSIGIRRALGVPARSIGVGLVGEGLLLAGAGSAVGVAAGWTIVAALGDYASAAVREAARLAVFDPTFLAELVAGILVVSLLPSAVAVRAAVRLPIAEALR